MLRECVSLKGALGDSKNTGLGAKRSQFRFKEEFYSSLPLKKVFRGNRDHLAASIRLLHSSNYGPDFPDGGQSGKKQRSSSFFFSSAYVVC